MLFCSVSAAALADGMPFETPAPKQNLTPIEQSLTTPPANTAAAPAPAPAPVPVAQQPETPLPPVPESRVVDVQPDTSFFGLSVGMYDPITHGGKSTAFNVEWQPGVKIMGTLQPLFGAMATTRNAMLGYAGVGVPFNITDHVFLMPSIAIGGYKPGDDYDLGRKIVERVGTELAYQFDDKSRLGVNFDVLTNGTSIQARDRTEMVLLTYTMPLYTPPAVTNAPPAIEAPAKPAVAAPPAPATSPVTPPATPKAKPLPNELP
jgi:hypothetical protein